MYLNVVYVTMDRDGFHGEGAEKTTPKLADLSPVLVYFSVIPFSPAVVVVDSFIFNVPPPSLPLSRETVYTLFARSVPAKGIGRRS